MERVGWAQGDMRRSTGGLADKSHYWFCHPQFLESNRSGFYCSNLGTFWNTENTWCQKISGDLGRGLMRQSHLISDSKKIRAITLVQGLSLQALSRCLEANFYSSKSSKSTKQAIPVKVCQGRKHKSSKHCGFLHLFFSKALCKFNGHHYPFLWIPGLHEGGHIAPGALGSLEGKWVTLEFIISSSQALLPTSP